MAIFLPYYVAAIALLYFELRGSRMPTLPAMPRWPPWVWAGVVVAAYAAQLAILYGVSTRTVPIAVAVRAGAHPDSVEGAMLALGLLQSLALVALYRAVPSKRLVWAGGIALLALSLASPVFGSPDPYAYVGDALLGRSAYTPPASAFAGEFAAIGAFFKPPLLPAPYGPLWLALVRLVTEPVPGLLGKLLALRAFGALGVAALLGALRACGVPPRIVAIAALNPALAQNYVCDAHNDALGIALAVAAAAALRRSAAGTPIAAAFVTLAGLVKLPFAVLAAPVFSRVASRIVRYASLAAAIGVTIAVSWLAGGAAYFGGLLVHVPVEGPAYWLNLAVALVALASLAVAFAGGRRLNAAVWPIAMMGSYVATWYVAYGLPYALARRRTLAYLLTALPFACALLDAKFMRPWTYAAVLPAVVVWHVWPRRAA